MSDLERVRRLPVFIDEVQWERAFHAAVREVEVLECQGALLPQTPASRKLLGVKIATAALRAAAQVEEEDISTVDGVSVSYVPPNH